MGPVAATFAFLLITAGDGAWEELFEKDGITVYTRDNGESQLPVLRGEGIVEGSILDVMAVFADDTRHEEWMHACRESRILERYGELEAVVYHRTRVPWPVSDRDVVMKAQLTYDLTAREAWNRFVAINHPRQPPVEGVVRMPRLKGFYHLLFIDAGHTAVVYEVESDPGGWLPRWMSALATRDLPYKTLMGLRRQVSATKGQYDGILRRWIVDLGLPKDLHR